MIFARLTQRWHALRNGRGNKAISQAISQTMSPLAQAHGVLAHVRFEDATFNGAYHEAVHGDAGLVLWQQDGEHGRFSLRLQSAAHEGHEGELTLSLIADGAILHRLSWIWRDGAGCNVPLPIVPFLTRNAGLWRDAGAAFEAFERAFPNNSPSFFCFAALQGAAQALGIDRVVAVRATAHPAYEAAQDAAFQNAYDGFWRILGGVEMDAHNYLITLPFYLKPLQDMPSKHRKRAAQRREHWRAIGDAARTTLLRYMAPGDAVPAIATRVPATAKA